MNPQSWISLAAIAVSTLLAVLLALARYAASQRDATVDTMIKSLTEQVRLVNDRVTCVEGKFEAKLDALLAGQNGIQKDIGEMRSRLEFERGSRTGVDQQMQELWNSLVTKEVFDARMTGLDREIRDIKADIAELSKRHR